MRKGTHTTHRHILSGVVFALVLGACAGTYRSATRSPVAQYVNTVEIQARCKAKVDDPILASLLEQDTPLGTGVAIDRTHVLTAYHVVDSEGADCEYIVVERDGSKHKATVEVVIKGADLARLKLDEKMLVSGKHPVVIGPRPQLGETICAVGMLPMPSRFCGQVQWPLGDPGDDSDLYHSIITQPGNSGGPIYDSAGRLVAIVTRYGKCMNGQLCFGRGTSLQTRPWLLL